jgi:hypothetical protein
MSREPIRICYQSYVDEEHGADYWHYLREHLSDIASLGTTVDGCVAVHRDDLGDATTQ